MASSIKAFLQGSAILALSNVTLKAISFFLMPLYTAVLTTYEYGISDTVCNVTTLVYMLLVFAFDSAYSAFYYDEDSQEHRDKVFNTVWFTLVATSCVAIVAMLLAEGISQLVFQTPDYALVIRIGLFGVVFNLWFLPFALDLRIRNKMMLFSAVTVTMSALAVLFNILFVLVFRWSYYSLIASTVIVNVLQFFAYLLLCKKRITLRLWDMSLFKSMFKFALSIVPSTLSYWVINLSNTYFILYFLSPAAVGIYGRAAVFTACLTLVSNAVFTSYSAYAFQTVREDNAQEKFAAILNAFFILFAFICFVICIFGKEILLVMADASYLEAYRLLPCLMFSQLAFSVATFVAYGALFKKKPFYNTIAVIVGAVVSLVCNLLLIPNIGVEGAAWSIFSSYVVLAIVTAVANNKLYPCPYHFARIALVFVALFVLLIFGIEQALWIRAIMFVGGVVLLVVVFKNNIRTLFDWIKRTLASRKSNR